MFYVANKNIFFLKRKTIFQMFSVPNRKLFFIKNKKQSFAEKFFLLETKNNGFPSIGKHFFYKK
jgi:hypothetical protein